MVTLAYVNIWGHRAGVVMWNENTQSAVFTSIFRFNHGANFGLQYFLQIIYIAMPHCRVLAK